MKGGSLDTFFRVRRAGSCWPKPVVPLCGDPGASGRHLAVPLSQYPRNYVEFSRAKARENCEQLLTTPHFKEVPIRPYMESSPYLAERGLL
jgi:hypothetical protein